jgi:hypothetical protein
MMMMRMMMMMMMITGPSRSSLRVVWDLPLVRVLTPASHYCDVCVSVLMGGADCERASAPPQPCHPEAARRVLSRRSRLITAHRGAGGRPAASEGRWGGREEGGRGIFGGQVKGGEGPDDGRMDVALRCLGGVKRRVGSFPSAARPSGAERIGDEIRLVPNSGGWLGMERKVWERK